MASNVLGIQKTVICLDTNFVSDMAKARLGVIEDPGARLTKLFSSLASLVTDNKAVCPHNVFLDIESELYPKLRDEIRGTISILSAGVRWRHWQITLESQAVRALHLYCGKQDLLPELDWREAFWNDPDDPLVVGYAVRAEWPVGGEVAASLRAAKKEYVRNVRTLTVREPGRSYEHFLAKELAGAAATYVQPIADLLDVLKTGDAAALTTALDHVRHTLRLYNCYLALTGSRRRFCALDPDFFAFFRSEQFRSVPHFEILSALYAGARFYLPKRSPCPGDSNDFRMMAAVLPYSDILATDSSAKDIACRMKLDETYGVQIYSRGGRDVGALLDHLAHLGDTDVARTQFQKV